MTELATSRDREWSPKGARARLVTHPPIELDDTERSLLCLESSCSLRTIERWASGKPVRRTTSVRLLRAMAKRGIAERRKVAAA